jgi:hypothetical protein
VIIFAVKRKADITIPVEKLASHLRNLNVKTIIVLDKSFFLNDIFKALKESPIANRVSLNIFFKILCILQYCKTISEYCKKYQILQELHHF